MRIVIFTLLLGVLTLATSVESYAQKHNERRFIRSGNDLFEKENYVESEVSYRRAIEKAPKSIEATYNLAGSLYKQEQFKEANEIYDGVVADSTLSAEVLAQTHYNSGNALFKQRELEKALEAYKSSLRINPNDMQTKFNLAYTQKLLDKEKEDQEKEDQDKDKDKEDQEKEDQKDKEDKEDKGDQEDQDKDKGDQDKDDQQDKDKPEDPKDKDGEENESQGKINKQAAEQMLNAAQIEEDKTREKQDAKKVKTVGNSGKNW